MYRSFVPYLLLSLVASGLCCFSARAQYSYQHPGAAYRASEYALAAQCRRAGSCPNNAAQVAAFQQIAGDSIMAYYRQRCPVPAAFLGDQGISSPWCLELGFANHADQMTNDGVSALSLAIRWYVDTSSPFRQQFRDKALALIDRWTTVPRGTSTDPKAEIKLLLLEVAPFMLLAADVLKASTWPSANWSRFLSWLNNTLIPTANEEIAVNVYGTWAPWGQNHTLWAFYNLFLAAYLKHDDLAITNTRNSLTYFLDGMINSNGELPNEVAREEKAHRYHYFSLAPILASFRLISNATGNSNLFQASDPIGKKVRRAFQRFFYFESHPESNPTYYGFEVDPSDAACPEGENAVRMTPTKCGYPANKQDEQAASLLDAAAAYYRVPEYAEYGVCHTPNGGFHPTHAYPAMINAIAGYLPAVNVARDRSERLRKHTFSGDFNDFVPASGSWQVLGGGYRQNSLTAVDATALAGDAQWMNYTLRADLTINQFGTSPAAVGLYARYVDANNYYKFYYNHNTQSLRLEQRVDGVASWQSLFNVSFVPGRVYSFFVKANGPHLRFSVSSAGANWVFPDVDHVRASPIDIDIAAAHWGSTTTYLDQVAHWAGKVGLFAHRADVVFDNVVVERIPVSESGLTLDSHGRTVASLASDGTVTCTSDPRARGEAPQQLVGLGSNRCVDVEDSARNDGASLQIYDCGNAANQTWTFYKGAFIGTDSGKCLDLDNGGTGNGTFVELNTCNGSLGQQWEWVDHGRLRNVRAGRCLDVIEEGTANHSGLQVWDCVGGNNQVWYMGQKQIP